MNISKKRSRLYEFFGARVKHSSKKTAAPIAALLLMRVFSFRLR